nr:hypothetical protein Iba_chr13cCG15780 [Ipomoea batatas]
MQGKKNRSNGDRRKESAQPYLRFFTKISLQLLSPRIGLIEAASVTESELLHLVSRSKLPLLNRIAHNGHTTEFAEERRLEVFLSALFICLSLLRLAEGGLVNGLGSSQN